MKVPVKRYWELLSQYLRHRRGQFLLLALLLFSSIGLQLLVPQITRRFIDLAQSTTPYRVLLTAAIGFIAASLGQQAITVFARYTGEKIAWGATNDLRIDVARHCLRLDMGFHNDKSPGEMIERVDGDLLAISKFFSQLVILVVGSVLLLIGIIIAFMIEDARIGLIFLGFAAATVLLFIKLRNIAVPHDKARREKVSELFGYIEERLAGTEDIRSSGAVDFVMHGIYRIHYELLKIWRTAELRHATIRLLAGVMMSVGYGIAFTGGLLLYRAGELTIGTVYLIVHYTELLNRPIRILTQQFQDLQNVGANIERVHDLLSITGRINDADSKEAQVAGESTGPVSVRFDDVCFSYVEDEQVLNNVSFEVSPRRILGLLGRTGSGKTTIARLIFRLYDIQTGSISVDGSNVRGYKLDNLRSRVAMVTQDVQLFQATVRQNLTFFDTSISDERLHEVIDNLGLSEWYESLPAGLDSKLASAGKGLSAGEAQLLAFTRIFLKDPGLVILDEASSRLDPATERLIERAVDKLLENRSAIIIAHRLGTVERADDILILDDGNAIEYGPRSELAVDADSKFYQLLKTGLEEVLA